jgi:hypothetical protein
LNGDTCEVATLEGRDISVADQSVVENSQEDQFDSYGKFKKHPDLIWNTSGCVNREVADRTCVGFDGSLESA